MGYARSLDKRIIKGDTRITRSLDSGSYVSVPRQPQSELFVLVRYPYPDPKGRVSG